MKYLETLTRECNTVKGKGTIVSIQRASLGKPRWPDLNLGSTLVCSRLLSEGLVAGTFLKNQGESDSNLDRRLEHPRLFARGNSWVGGRSATPGVTRISKGTRGSRGHSTLMEMGANGFAALVATIQQRDSANERAEFWRRAFLLLVAFTGTASTTIGFAWMKGRL